MHSKRRVGLRLKSRVVQYAKCVVKTVTFIFCASLYLLVMKLTILKPDNLLEKESSVDDNDTILSNTWASNYEEKKPVSLLANLSESEYRSLQDEYQARIRQVEHTCRKYDIQLSSGKINSKEFFVDPGHGLIWCNIFKAASSSWMYNFNILGGYPPKFLEKSRQTPLMLARRLFPRPSETKVLQYNSNNDVLSFLIVREPFERLLSAFRDKLEHKPLRFYRKLAQNISRKYRESNSSSRAPTFAEFVKYIIANYKEKGDSGMDEHWAPYYKFCTPCLMHFKLIVKVETLQRDNEFILKELDLTDVLARPPEGKRTRVKTIMNKSRDGRNTTALLKSYFGTIDRSMLDELLKIYGIDFEMFGYDAEVYKKYVKKLKV